MNLRAIHPLDSVAVAKANTALQPRTGGRPLTVGDSDAENRTAWMEAYRDAGGKTEEAPRNTDQPTGPVQRCLEERVKVIFVRANNLPFSGKRIVIRAGGGREEFTTDSGGMIEYEAGLFSNNGQIIVEYDDRSENVTWQGQIPDAPGLYTVPLTIWSNNVDVPAP